MCQWLVIKEDTISENGLKVTNSVEISEPGDQNEITHFDLYLLPDGKQNVFIITRESFRYLSKNQENLGTNEGLFGWF